MSLTPSESYGALSEDESEVLDPHASKIWQAIAIANSSFIERFCYRSVIQADSTGNRKLIHYFPLEVEYLEYPFLNPSTKSPIICCGSRANSIRKKANMPRRKIFTSRFVIFFIGQFSIFHSLLPKPKHPLQQIRCARHRVLADVQFLFCNQQSH